MHINTPVFFPNCSLSAFLVVTHSDSWERDTLFVTGLGNTSHYYDFLFRSWYIQLYHSSFLFCFGAGNVMHTRCL